MRRHEYLGAPLDLSVHEQDETLDRIFAMIGDAPAAPHSVRRVKRRQPPARAPKSIPWALRLSTEERDLLLALGAAMKQDDQRRNGSRADTMRRVVKCGADLFADDPSWADEYRTRVRRAKNRSVAISLTLKPDLLAAFDRLAAAMRVRRPTAARAALLSLYLVYADEGLVPAFKEVA